MSQSSIIRQSEGFLDTLPIGVVLAWHRDLSPSTYVPQLPAGWVPCDGQTLDDPESPFHGQAIPDLNGDVGSGGGGRFLRGGSTSGITQQDEFQSHGHSYNTPHQFAVWATGGSQSASGGDIQNLHFEILDPTETTAGTPRHGSENRPANMSVIWIFKAKYVISARAVPVVQGALNAPVGALYIGESGSVGIGTSTPAATLQVNGTFHAPGSVVQVVTVPVNSSLGPGANNDWSDSLLSLTIEPKFSSSKIIVSCCGKMALDDTGADPHLHAKVRIMAGVVQAAGVEVNFTHKSYSFNVPFHMEAEYVPVSISPVVFDIQLYQRTGTTAYIFGADGPYLFKAMEIAQ